MNINGIKIMVTEGSLTNALFNCSTLEAFGSFTKAEARQAARVMLAGPELLAALRAVIGNEFLDIVMDFDIKQKAHAAISKAEGRE